MNPTTSGPIRPTFPYAAPRTKPLPCIPTPVNSTLTSMISINHKCDDFSLFRSISDDVIPQVPDISGRGTYVIRKGRRRQRLESLDSNASNNLPIPSSEPPPPVLPSPIFPASMLLPKSRHSIDLGLTSSGCSAVIKTSHSAPQKLPNSVLSPR